MPLPPPPAGLLGKIGKPPAAAAGGPADLMKSLQARQAAAAGGDGTAVAPKAKAAKPTCPEGKLFHYEESLDAFLFDHSKTTPKLTPDAHGNADTDILVPLPPCAYRMTDYTLAKKEPVLLKRCVLKLGVLRCLQRECENLNHLLWSRLSPDAKDEDKSHALEESELGKARFMELLSNCGVYQKVAELVLTRAGQVAASLENKPPTPKGNGDNPFKIPQIVVEGLDDFLEAIERLNPSLQQARDEIESTQTVSFYPGLGELFCPGSKLLVHPDGMEGSPLGCSLVQSWYVEELNKATNKTKRRFILVIEFIVSVGEELCFVAASDVVPEFHDTTRNVPLKDLVHRKLNVSNAADAALIDRLQQRGEFYASVATHNHYLEYYPNSFFPILSGWSNNAVRPLSKGGRVMVDVKRGILEGHMPIRATSDGMSDTGK